MTEPQLRQKVVSIAQGFLGLKESDGSHMKIINIYNSQAPLPRNYKMRKSDAWCAAFVSVVAIQAGLTDIIPTECSCARMIECLKAIGAYVENDAYVPKPEDILFYDWQDGANYATTDNRGAPDHVGIIEQISSGMMTIMEGNYNDRSRRRNVRINGRYIRGYGVPKYASKEDTATVPNTSGVPAIGDTVNFTGSVQYLSAYSGSRSVAAKPCSATVTAIASGKQHPYHLVGNGVEGWVDAATIEGVTESNANPETIKVGDEVVFNGAVHYKDSYAANGYPCKGGEAKVTAINRNGIHAYCLESIGKVCTANGWVDAEFVTRPTGERAEKGKVAKAIAKA